MPLLLLLGCESAPQEPPTSPPPAEGTPRLVVVVVVDQARADYLVRFRPLFEGGLDRLLRESVVFENAHHDHASTKTAPGYATLATGLHPSRHGIIANEWLDRDSGEVVESDEDDRYDEDRSPHRLLAPTLGDWMKERWPESKIWAAAGKSRSAVLPGGRLADGALWLDDETGRFVTSDYYGESPPGWLSDFHRDPWVDRFFGTVWEPLLPLAEVPEDLGVEPLERGLGHHQFPHPVGRASVAPDESYYEDFYRTPFSDRYLLELASTLIGEEDLGADSYPDLLGLGLSALDLVGHHYGPDSPEVLDTLLRIDRMLGELLALLDRRVGLDRTLVVLGSDHGIPPVPEVRAARGGEARRFGVLETSCVQGVAARLDELYGEGDWFVGDLYLDPETAAARDVEPAELARSVATLIEGCPGIARAWTRSELTAPPTADDDPMLAHHRHGFHPARSPDVVVQFDPWVIARTDSSTTHGSPYPYDTHVPLLLRLPAGRGTRIEERVRTVDVAPTVAGLLGLEPPAGLDGADLGDLIRGR